MPLYNSQNLLDTLEKNVEQTIRKATYLQSLKGATLALAPGEGKWSVLQVLYHLNSYNNYYLPHITDALNKGRKLPAAASFKPGLIGNYFAKMMQPGNDGKIKNTMKAPKDHIAILGFSDVKAIADFIAGQQRLLQLIKAARKANMTRITVPISISKFIKIRLGDTFRFLIVHQQRHFVQIDNTLTALGVAWLEKA